MVNKVPRLISKARFSEEAGVSRAAVTKACATLLSGAVSGSKIDIDHPDAVAYIRSKQTPKTPANPKAKRKPPAAPKVKRKTKAPKAPSARKTPKVDAETPSPLDEPHYSKDKNIDRVLHMTLAQLVKAFGTDEQFKAWATANKVLSDTREKDLKVAKMEGSLIPRELVQTHIFGAIEAANLRLLSDTPKTLVRRLYALAKAGESVEDGEKLARDLISDQLRSLKATAKRLLK